MKINRLLSVFAVCAFALASCGSAASTQAPVFSNTKGVSSGMDNSMAVEAPMAEMAYDQAAAPSAAGGYSDASTTASTEQMVVKTASLNVLVDDPSKTLEDIMSLADTMGGYTVSSNRYQSYASSGVQYPSANVTIRVPADKLTDALTQIKNMTGDAAKFVTNENVSGEDVTKTYTDLKSRLTNLQEADVELTKMYEKAVKAEDVLAIYNQKMQVTEQIEVIKGQMQYYEDASATSSITVQIDAKASVQPITVAGWEPKGIARDAVQALVNFLKGLANFLIWFGILGIPVILVFGLPIFFIVRGIRRRNKAKKARLNQIPPMPTEQK